MPFAHPFTRADLEAAGYPLAALRFWLGKGHVQRVSRGVYAVPTLALPVTKPMLSGSQVASLEVAAGLHGLSVPPGLRPFASRPSRSDRLSPEQVTWASGVLVPTSACTAVHLARFQPIPHALIPLDSALRQGVSHPELQREVAGLSGRRGTQLLAQALELADGAAESALESLARGSMWSAGTPKPTLQAWINCGGRSYRVDFAWLRQRLIVEADGMVKYSRSEDMWAEKRRHSALQAAGFEVRRCIWSDVAEPNTPFVRQLLQRLEVPLPSAVDPNNRGKSPE